MNEGKICVSVIGETVEDLLAKVEAAGRAADIVEVRTDALKPADLQSFFEQLKSDKLLIITLRPIAEGGKSEADFNQRLNFWMSVYSQFPHDSESAWFDNEFDLRAGLEWPSSTVIVRSHHNFESVPKDIFGHYDSVPQHEIFKIAYAANDITDTIPIFQLLERAHEHNKNIVPIAMGEAGKISRILGLAHGAAFTFASLDNGEETAAGQITATQLNDVFRVKQLGRETDVYGVIAGDTSYSMSPSLHNAAFAANDVNAVFAPLQVRNLDGFINRMVKGGTREIDLNFKGFSVTNPHKQKILKYLDEIDQTASEIGAVNTIKFEKDGTLHGFNTDAAGFIEPLKKQIDIAGKKAAVIGGGGAARACMFALMRDGADVTVFARDFEKAKLLANDMGAESSPFDANTNFEGFDIVVNATPVGTKGREEDPLIFSDALQGVEIVYDLTYNPNETKLLAEAKKANAKTLGGLEMLLTQAAAQYKIWTGKLAPLEVMAKAAKRHLKL